MANRRITICKESGCQGPRVCRACKNLYMQNWRRTGKEKLPDEEERKKKKARKITAMRIFRGKLQRQPCEVCKAVKTEAHHEDYDNPNKLRWLCAFHHRFLHSLFAKEDGPIILGSLPAFQNPNSQVKA